jgi:hypothetical protein
MATHGDYLPQKEDDLLDWAENFSQQVANSTAAWQIPQDEVAALQNALSSFRDLHAQTSSPAKNSILVAEKNAAKDELIRIIRAMVNFRFANPLITDAIRVQCGLHVKDHVHTSHGAPTTRPEFEVRDKDFRRLDIDFRDQGSSSRAKPYGMTGAVVSWAALDHVPAEPGALSKTILVTRTPFTLEFTEEDRGKTVYIALQWQNAKGQKGPWSEIKSAIIP